MDSKRSAAEPSFPRSRPGKSRAALLQAGLTLFAERPVDAVPIDEIVTVAGVAKGTFFNHFADKHAFAGAIASEIRLEIEDLVATTNRDVSDPMDRLANGMRVAGNFALSNRQRTQILLRMGDGMPSENHPLNRGVSADISAAVRSGQARPEAELQGVPYWLSLCQGLMVQLTAGDMKPDPAVSRIEAMVVMGLSGISFQHGGQSS